MVDAADAAAQLPDARVQEEVTLLEAAKVIDEGRAAADAGDYPTTIGRSS